MSFFPDTCKGTLTANSRHAVLLLIIVFLTASCGMHFSSAQPGVSPGEISGTWSVIVYGGRHANDLETIGFFDREDDDYSIVINAPEFDYKITRSLATPDALTYAREAVGFHRSFQSMHVSRIVAPDGYLVGYELRPLYPPFEFGYQDVLDVSYAWRGKTLVVSVRLKPQVRRQLDGDDPRNRPFLFRR
ncbi:MAG TPA: hypothetical protein VLH56_12850 [Dissulfurispiraceae bacterium]|nr:hypothetical protein [Dissulfurispiraceae bacterium]